MSSLRIPHNRWLCKYSPLDKVRTSSHHSCRSTLLARSSIHRQVRNYWTQYWADTHTLRLLRWQIQHTCCKWSSRTVASCYHYRFRREDFLEKIPHKTNIPFSHRCNLLGMHSTHWSRWDSCNTVCYRLHPCRHILRHRWDSTARRNNTCLDTRWTIPHMDNLIG